MLKDFLNACQDAMPHVKSLQILNDCEENLKLVKKLPDWLASSWNRKVTQTLNETYEFPSFKNFTTFMLMEAEIACNPINSFSALRLFESITDKQRPRETKRNKASVLNTQTAADTENTKSNGRPGLPCIVCQDSKHQIHVCPKFMEKSLEENEAMLRKPSFATGA